MTGILSAGLLLAATAVLAVPGGSRTRLQRLTGTRSRPWPWFLASGRQLLAWADGSQRGAVSLAGCGFGLLGAVGYGPVGGVVAAAYGGLAVRVGLRRRATGASRQALQNTLDGLACLVGDLRAGVPPAAALDAALPLLIGVPARGGGVTAVADLAGHVDPTPRGQVLVRLAAAWQVAGTIGAPLGQVLERLDAEVRSGERARALAVAHAASAQATATLLGALPLAGIALGYGMGADPLAVLLGTPAGAVCAISAVVLHLIGLGWSRRLVEIDPNRMDPAGAGR
jgi:tight adherence protein B